MLNFLVWWNPLTWLSDAQEGVSGVIYSGIRILFYFINSHLYGAIIYLYNLFEALCHGRLLNTDVIDKMSSRIGIVLGIAMLFYVVIAFIQFLISPDELVNEKTGAGNVIKKVLIVIVLLGMSSFAFETLYQVQIAVIDSHVISKLFLPYEVETEDFGAVLSSELFTSFYRVDTKFLNDEGEVSDEIEEMGDVEECQSYFWTLKDEIYDHGNFDLGNACLNSAVPLKSLGERSYGNVEGYVMRFDVLFMTIIGVIICYLLISYCITVGTRMIQLTLLEIISPVAIISYLSPKQDGMFKSWKDLYVATYLDIFLRIAVINVVVYLCATILSYGNLESGDSEFWSSIGTINRGDEVVIAAMMIVALLAFAKKAPDLIQNLFPQSKAKLGMGGLHLKDVVGGNVIAGAGRTAVGAATGAAVGIVTAGFGRQGWRNKLTGALGGGFTGLFRGGAAGAHGKGVGGSIRSAASKQWTAMKDANSDYNRGATLLGRVGNKASDILTAGQTRIVQMKNEKEAVQRELTHQQQIVSQRKQQNAQSHKTKIDAISRSNKSLQAVSSAKSSAKDLAMKRLHAGKLDGLDAKRSGANSVLNLESKISAIQEKKKNVNPSDTAKIASLNSELLSLQGYLDNATKTFVKNYYDNADNDELVKYKSIIHSEISNNSDLYSGHNDSNWDAVDALGNHAESTITTNDISLNKLQTEYENTNVDIENYERANVETLQNRISELDQQIAQAEIKEGPWGPTISGGYYPPPTSGPFPFPPPPGGNPPGGNPPGPGPGPGPRP